MRVIRVHRRVIGGTTAYIRECPTIWIVSRAMGRGESGVCGERYHKRDHKTIDKLVRHLLDGERKKYAYENSLGALIEVTCTYKEFLYLKLNYGMDGLSEVEFEIYKSL